MDFEKQKPVSDEYRENWERVFIREVSIDFQAQLLNESMMRGVAVYPNGCPILSEDNG